MIHDVDISLPPVRLSSTPGFDSGEGRSLSPDLLGPSAHLYHLDVDPVDVESDYGDEESETAPISRQSAVLQSRFASKSASVSAFSPVGSPEFSFRTNQRVDERAPLVSPGSILGRGAFGIVRMESCNDQLIAQKIMRHRAAEDERAGFAELQFARRAIEVAERCPHLHVWAHIVEVYEAYFDATTGETVVTMEFMPGGAVDALAEFQHSSVEALPLASQRRLARVMRDVLLGLQTLHDTLEVLHRDLKPSNILIAADGTAKLADFGASARVDADLDQAGSTLFMAPERLRGDPHGPASDVWSVGVCALMLASGGLHPFLPTAESLTEEVFWTLGAALGICHSEAAASEQARETVECAITACLISDPLFGDFLRATLSPSPDSRATVRQLLRHPWLLSAAE
jgi:serine/threonine protein kinase